MASRESEADALMRSAKKKTEKSLLKWKPDWDAAATDYENAAKIYTHLSNLPKSREAWQSASHAHEKAGNAFFAARALESLASLLAQHPACTNEALEAFANAGHRYAMDGKFDKQADLLHKAAQLLNPADAAPSAESVRKVSEMTRAAIELLETHASEQAVYNTRLPDMYRAWLLLHLRAKDLKGAVAVQERLLGLHDASHRGLYDRLQQPHNAAKAGLEMVLLCLSQGDVVWATQEMGKLRQTVGFVGSKEAAAAAELLAAYEERDVEQLEEAKRNVTLQFITADISRMARRLTIQSRELGGAGTSGVKPKPPQQQQQQQQQESLPEVDPEEDIR